MKKITIILLSLILFSCEKDDPAPKPEAKSTDSRYWGLWSPVNGVGYCIRLTEGDDGHIFTFEPIGLSLENGIIRNDSFIVDNGLNEYWAFEQNGTLTYSAYGQNPDTLYYFKSEDH